MALLPTKHRRLTVSQQKFIAAFVECGGRIRKAAELSKVSSRTHYEALKSSPLYGECFADAEQKVIDDLEGEAKRRALVGVEEYIFHQGQPIRDPEDPSKFLKKVTYSDSLLTFLLKGLAPEKYGNKTEVELSGKNGAPIRVANEFLTALSDDQLAKLVELTTAIEQAGEVIDVTPEPKQIESGDSTND
jgi:hypothetical protein